MEVDHFDPKKKKDLFQDYNNLLLVSRHCNGAKQNRPTPVESNAGLRFLNPCQELDYGLHMFEDPQTHRLVGVTPLGKYHIRCCDLNADHLVQERKDRTEIWNDLKNTPITIQPNQIYESVSTVITSLQAVVEKMIPVLPILK